MSTATTTSTTAAARVLVTGSARWTCWRTITAALSLVWEPDAVLVTGACPEGAEELAARCWEHWGGHVERWPFDWDIEGSVVSGRHEAMLCAGADVCLGFASSTGAASLITMARVAGVATYEWSPPSGLTLAEGCLRNLRSPRWAVGRRSGCVTPSRGPTP